jgi:hypothetical protein
MTTRAWFLEAGDCLFGGSVRNDGGTLVLHCFVLKSRHIRYHQPPSFSTNDIISGQRVQGASYRTTSCAEVRCDLWNCPLLAGSLAVGRLEQQKARQTDTYGQIQAACQIDHQMSASILST